MRGRVILLFWCLAAVTLVGGATYAQNRAELRPPSAFAAISDPQARSRMLFTEAAKVIMNPRCMNCHPATDRPTQGNDMHPHSPPVTRGADGGGVPGNTCGACHMNRNVPIFAGQQTSFQSLPGHSRWGSRRSRWRGRASRSARSAGRSRTRGATADVISRCCTSIWRTMISSAGPGTRGRSRPRARHPGAAGRTGQGLDRQRRRVSVGRFTLLESLLQF